VVGRPPNSTPPRVLNLTFHGVGEPSNRIDEAERRLWISAEALSEVLDLVAVRDDVRLTFDDGNVSDATIALPALTERGLTATFFLVVGRIGRPGFTSADDVRELLEAGMEIGSHGMAHRAWRHLPAAELRSEVLDARAALEAYVGLPVRAAACPFGAYDRRVLRALRAAGFERVFTSDGGLATPSGWLQPRNTLCAGNASRVVDRLLAQPASRTSHRRRVELLAKRWR
jgi:peptidoglycan/xylan/chitin deacetylase (PgdA/CDA1 family)